MLMTDCTRSHRLGVFALTCTTGTMPTGWGLDSTATMDMLWYDVRVPEWLRLDIPKVPAWWRWYDVFRTWAKPKLLPPLEGYRMIVRKVQERYPAKQRARRKRRAYVQALHAF